MPDNDHASALIDEAIADAQVDKINEALEKLTRAEAEADGDTAALAAFNLGLISYRAATSTMPWRRSNEQSSRSIRKLRPGPCSRSQTCSLTRGT